MSMKNHIRPKGHLGEQIRIMRRWKINCTDCSATAHEKSPLCLQEQLYIIPWMDIVVYRVTEFTSSKLQRALWPHLKVSTKPRKTGQLPPLIHIILY